MNRLHDGLQHNLDNTALSTIFDELLDYTGKHFAAEEEAFAASDYPMAEQHKQAHRKLVAKALEIREQFHNGEAMIGIDLLRFLKDWVVNHIQGMDQSYEQHLNAHGIN